ESRSAGSSRPSAFPGRFSGAGHLSVALSMASPPVVGVRPRAMIRAHLRRYGALRRTLDVQRVRLACGHRAPPRSWTLLTALAGSLRTAASARGRSGHPGVQGQEARREVLVAVHDRPAALADEVLDLQVDDAALVVRAHARVPPVADDQLAARERVADLRRGAAVDVGAVEDGDDAARVVDRRAVVGADLL